MHMVFKNITFKHTDSGIDSKIHELVSQKLSPLQKYVNDNVEVRIDVEFEKVAAQKSGPICRVEVNFWVGVTLYRAEATQVTYEAAVDVVKGELDQEMRRAHNKQTSLIRKGGRAIKEMMRFGKKK